MSSVLSQKPMVVIDLESGSYTITRKGHELFNRIPNEIDGRYYGYCPPHDDLRIEGLGAKKSDDEVSGVIVVYTTKYRKTNDRVIVAFTDNATVHRESKRDRFLHRTIEEGGKRIDCSYSIESDNLYNLDDYPIKFVIRIADYNPYMFRRQRFYKGKYPRLDKKILSYLEQFLHNTNDEDTLLFQRLIQEADAPEEKIFDDNSQTPPEYTVSGGSKGVNKKASISKRALVSAHFQCEVDVNHLTFQTERGVPYMEGHHLIPCTYDNAVRFFDEQERNIDCVQNIVCLCPTCHRRVHFGSKVERESILKILYDKQIAKLRSAGIDISYKELVALYE
ncbi:MAG: HNH endonuclease [Bacteroidales bacterium]|nr:HNH endonuclease [Bacteroidales bacterium]